MGFKKNEKNSSSTCERAIVILADGARADVMEELIAEQRLPNIARWMLASGSLRKAVTVFPSTTGPAYLPFLTGTSPGFSNIPGIRWMDKEQFASAGWLSAHRSYVGLESFLISSDIARPIKTIFELVPRSYNIFNTIARGAGWRNRTRLSRLWYWYYAHLTDRWSFVDRAALAKTLECLQQRPCFLFVVFPGIDEYSHLAHPQHEQTIAQYLWLDHSIGKIAEELERRGEWATTQLWIVSDHGLSKTDTHYCLNTFLEGEGLAPFYYPRIHSRFRKQAATMVSGNGMAHLYFRGERGWNGCFTRGDVERLSPQLLPKLIAQPAVDVVMVRNSDGGIDVISKRGEAKIFRRDQRLLYLVQQRDPFGYPPCHPEQSAESSLAATFASDYPDAPVQIANLFRSRRTGDVVISAALGSDLRLKYEHPEHRGSHGSLHRLHMMTPLLCNRPLPERPIRTVDVFPTILESLGIEVPAYAEGKSLRVFS